MNPPSGADDAPPTGAMDAVHHASLAMPQGAQRVEELDFNKLTKPITAEDLYLGMQNMGFQASSMSEAIRIINGMVSKLFQLSNLSTYFFRANSGQHAD